MADSGPVFSHTLQADSLLNLRVLSCDLQKQREATS